MLTGTTVYEVLGNWPGWACLAVFAVVFAWKRASRK